MSSQSKSIQLDQSIEIYVPTQCRCGQLLPEDIRAEVLEEVKASMYNWFGGVSKKDGIRVEENVGSWRLKSGEMANERVDVVYSNTNAEALATHFEELLTLAASIANRLTQESVAFRVNEKMTLMPGQDTRPHRCAGGTSPGSLPVSRQPDEKERMRGLQASLQRISSVRDARDLFCNVLHYEFEDEQLAMVNWPDKLKESLAPGTSPQIIANQNGFKIIYLQLAEDYLRKGHERQLVQRIAKDDPTLRSLVVVSDVDQKQWHLVNAKLEKEDGKQLRLRRMRVGPSQSVRTAAERLAMVDIETAGENTTAAELQDMHDRAFDVESVSKEFFNEISNWYFWALSQVEFPVDTLTGDDEDKHRATSLIRFLTRIIFCWFLKEKGLIPESLFRQKDLENILVELDPDSCTYHQGILQNLFFATLNQRMGKDNKGKPWRAFAKDYLKDKSTYGVDTLYRYEEHFQDPDAALSHFADVPFLNGGLFECLDGTDEESGKKRYVDGFSRNKKKRARVPNGLFFAGEQSVDLSEVYGDTGRRNARVRGLLNILHSYNFTVEENTPIDEEIALDPELLGKVFENLLASYNEETKTTARKQTGSFYTPRPIVEYMVDEALKAHLTNAFTKQGREEKEAHEQLDLLLGYTDEEPSLSEREIVALLEAIHTCKILDPACGSGAFPIGMLQKLVHVVHKLDPENARWKQLQIDEASRIPDASARDAAIKAIERDFEDYGDDYGRKLYLIENCLYGVDIQPIAIQISKLRFFISLTCDQKTNRDKAKNHGIRALPNLETKFVAANTLISLPEMEQLALVSPRVHEIESKIESLYHRHFSIQRRDQKLALQRKLRDLRKELGRELSQSLGSSQKAQQLADWDPFDSQASSNFFEPFWMFGRSLNEGFDIVISNPPYIRIQTLKKTAPDLVEYLKGNYIAAAQGNYDIYTVFVEAGLNFLTKNGHMAYILPHKFFNATYGKQLRGRIVSGDHLSQVVHFGDLQIFSGATTYVCLLFLSNSSRTQCRWQCVRNLEEWFATHNAEETIIPAHRLTDSEWNFETGQGGKLLEKLQQIPVKLGDVTERIFQGLVTGADSVFLLNRNSPGNYFSKSTQKNHSIEEQIMHPLCKGSRDLRRYTIGEVSRSILFPYQIVSSNAHLIPVEQFETEFPNAWEYLQICRTILEGRERGRWRNASWYALGRSQNLNMMEQEKILTPSIASRACFSLDDSGEFYFTGSGGGGGGGYGITLRKDCELSSKYILGILNSKLLEFFLKRTATPFKRGYFACNRQYIEPLPIRLIDFSNLDERARHNRIVELAEDILSAKKSNGETDTSYYESEINEIVYDLYDLDSDEIQVVEEAVA